MLDITQEIAWFRHLTTVEAPRVFDVETLCSDSALLKPKQYRALPQKKPIGLTLLALIHGNEWGGVGVLNRFLELLITDAVQLRVPLAVALGNVPGALANVRFRGRDLNRSFGRKESTLDEEMRADELEKILMQSEFLLDFHQTRETSLFPFFISPYTKRSFAFATCISRDFPIITHWGKPFSPEGRCTDEFVNQSGGAGMTLELGQNGLDLRQIAAGVQSCINALHAVHNDFAGAPLAPAFSFKNKLYTWAQVVPCDDPKAFVKPGFINFSPVKKGESLGKIHGKEIICEHEGRILFPKYDDHNPENAKATAAMEFCRIMKEISLDHLPKD